MMRRNKAVLYLGAIALLSVILIVGLYAFSDLSKDHRHNFVRSFKSTITETPVVLDVKYNSYYLAGASGGAVYLGNPTGPFHLLVTKKMLTDTQHFVMRIKDFHKYKFRTLTVSVDSPFFYLKDGLLPGVFRGKIKNWIADTLVFNTEHFTHVIPIGNSFVVRSIDPIKRIMQIGKKSPTQPEVIFPNNILERQSDGVFSVDGKLTYNKENSFFVYMYFYRNQFIVMDTNLNVVLRGNTIDTVSAAKIKVGKISSENSETMAAPPLIVNKNSAVYGNWLFIHSKLLSKNEDENDFNNSSVIDVYNLKSNQYEFSFYIPDYKGKKFRDVIISDNQVFVLNDHYLLRYDLRYPIAFNDFGASKITDR